MTDTGAVQQLFDELAFEYDQHVPFFATFGRDLAAWIGLRPGRRVLDIAAGRGAVAGPAARAVGSDGAVLAIDNAPNMLRALADDCRGVPRLAASVMDARWLGVRDACFDAVTCGFAFHFVDNPRLAIAEAYRVLRPGGVLAFSGPPTGPPPDLDTEPDLDTVPVRGKQPDRDRQWAFYVAELMKDMARRADEADKPDPFTPPPRPLPELCAEAGFTGIEQLSARAAFALRDPQHYWDWSMSHGFRGYIDSLGPRLGEEFRVKMFAGLERMHASGGIILDSTVVFTRMHKA